MESQEHKIGECRNRKNKDQEEDEKAKLSNSVERDPEYDEELGFVCLEVTNIEENEMMLRNEETRGDEQDTALVSIHGRHYPSFKGNTMIANTGCSCHLVRNKEYLEEVEEINECISSHWRQTDGCSQKGKDALCFQEHKRQFSLYLTLYPVKVVRRAPRRFVLYHGRTK